MCSGPPFLILDVRYITETWLGCRSLPGLCIFYAGLYLFVLLFQSIMQSLAFVSLHMAKICNPSQPHPDCFICGSFNEELVRSGGNLVLNSSLV